MNTNLILASTVAMSILVSCKQAADMRPGAKSPSGGSTNNNPSTEQVAVAQAKSPKMLLARVKASDINQPKSQIEIVSIDQSVAITNGEQAARAFAAGHPMQLSQGANGPEASNANYKVALIAATNKPAASANTNTQQMALGGVVLGYPPGYGPDAGYGSAGYGSGGYNNGYGSGAGYGSGYGYGNILYSVGGFLSYIGAVTSTIGSLLGCLNPYSWVGNIGIGYGGTGAYPNGGYQYYPYGQTNGPVITGPYPQYPNQQYPNQQYPNQQYPQYPNPQYPNQQYPNQQYPQYPNPQYPQTGTTLPGQPPQPNPPTGQEQMPQI